MLQPFAQDIWMADGPVHRAAAGFDYPTRMTVIRLADGALWLWSPIPLTPAVSQAVEALGPVGHLVAPNGLHDSWIADWAAAFPAARLHLAPGLAAKRPDLTGAAMLDAPDASWAGEVDQVMIRTALTDEVIFFHRASATVLITDLMQNIPPETYRGWRKLVSRMDLMTSGQPQVPRKFRLALRDRSAARDAVRQILAWHPRRLILAHGAPVTVDAHRVLERGFDWLRP